MDTPRIETPPPAYTMTLDDLVEDAYEFRELITSVPIEDWERPTPADGWSVRDQVAHVAFVFDLAAAAATDPARFAAETAQAELLGFDSLVQVRTADIARLGGFGVLDTWDEAFGRAMAALRSRDGADLAPWLAGPIPVEVLTRAGTMELFAHGQDVADGLELTPVRTDRTAHLVNFVYRTRDFGYLARQLDPPTTSLRFEVTLPSGTSLCAGPEDADQTVSGDAVELCLVAARRRHRRDTGLTANGVDADRWLSIAQAYRGPAGKGRQPGQFVRGRA